MRLCYIANPFSIHTQRWLAWFVQRGHEVHLVDLRARERPAAPPMPGVVLHEILKEPRLPLPHGQGLLYYPAAALRLWRLLRRLRPRLLHGHYIAEHAWVAAMSRFQPLVLTAWGGDVLPEQGAFERPVQRLLTPFAIRSAAVLTAGSPHLGRAMERYRRPSTRLLIVNHGVDRQVFRPGLESAELRAALQLGGGPLVFSPRSLAPVYCIETIVHAWPAVVAALPHARLLVASFVHEPAYDEHIRQLVAALGIQASVLFLGRIEHAEMARYYNMAAVTVSVTASDGLPVTVLEAMACGSALVVSDLPWHAGILEHERNALLVPVGAAEALSQALLRLLTDAALRQRLARANVDWVAAHADLDQEMLRVERAYEQL